MVIPKAALVATVGIALTVATTAVLGEEVHPLSVTST
jgi:hypothetical protein